jgi:hypothetical protein
MDLQSPLSVRKTGKLGGTARSHAPAIDKRSIVGA